MMEWLDARRSPALGCMTIDMNQCETKGNQTLVTQLASPNASCFRNRLLTYAGCTFLSPKAFSRCRGPTLMYILHGRIPLEASLWRPPCQHGSQIDGSAGFHYISPYRCVECSEPSAQALDPALLPMRRAGKLTRECSSSILATYICRWQRVVRK